jgi:hypothetical protein
MAAFCYWRYNYCHLVCDGMPLNGLSLQLARPALFFRFVIDANKRAFSDSNSSENGMSLATGDAGFYNFFLPPGLSRL